MEILFPKPLNDITVDMFTTSPAKRYTTQLYSSTYPLCEAVNELLKSQGTAVMYTANCPIKIQTADTDSDSKLG